MVCLTVQTFLPLPDLNICLPFLWNQAVKQRSSGSFSQMTMNLGMFDKFISWYFKTPFKRPFKIPTHVALICGGHRSCWWSLVEFEFPLFIVFYTIGLVMVPELETCFKMFGEKLTFLINYFFVNINILIFC